MTFPTKIDNLKEKMKASLLERINKMSQDARLAKKINIECTEDFNNKDIKYKYLRSIRPKPFNEEKLEKFLHWFIYEGEKSALVRDLIKFNGADAFDINFLHYPKIFMNFTGIESEFLIEVTINCKYYVNKGAGTQGYLSDNFFRSILENHLPNIFAKHSSFYLKSNAKIIHTNAAFAYYCLYQEYEIEYLNSIGYNTFNGEAELKFEVYYLEELRCEIKNFLSDPKYTILIIKPIDYSALKFPIEYQPDEAVKICKQVKIFKKPPNDYILEFQLIHSLCAKWEYDFSDQGLLEVFDFDYISRYLDPISVEISEDETLEIYGSVNSFEKILLGTMLSEVGFGRTSTIGNFYIKSYYNCLLPIPLVHGNNKQLDKFLTSRLYRNDDYRAEVLAKLTKGCHIRHD